MKEIEYTYFRFELTKQTLNDSESSLYHANAYFIYKNVQAWNVES